ncbi:MAG: glycosyltransferase [Thermoplasmata archaeon]
MASEAPFRPLISIVITVRNEEPNLRRLFDGLLVQESPFEIIFVDALSRDRSFDIAQEYARRVPGSMLAFQRYGSRGVGRNAGVAFARGEFVAFIDGDCVPDPAWLAALRRELRQADVVAGRTEPIGRVRYGALERIELYQKGSDVTYPSCNLAYRRVLFEQLGGFDPRFITAEDIDLNLRAVRRGATIRYAPDAIVYHQMRTTVIRFLYQAFWNGYGRKQLTEKHGSLWSDYRPRRLFRRQRGAMAWLRLSAAAFGYSARIVGGRGSRLTPAASTPIGMNF